MSVIEVRSLSVHETLPCHSATPVFACKVGVGVHDRHTIHVLVDPVGLLVRMVVPATFCARNRDSLYSEELRYSNHTLA